MTRTGAVARAVAMRGLTRTNLGWIHYRMLGEGPAMVLLHPALSSSAFFGKTVHRFAESFRVLAIDLPGHGDSDPLACEPEIPQYTDAMLAVLTDLGIRRCSLLGAYAGATVAVDLAARYPSTVNDLVLFGCPFWKDDGDRMRARKSRRFAPQRPRMDGSHLEEIWRDVRQVGASIDETEVLALDRVKALASVLGGQEAHYAVFGYDIRRRLPLVTSRTLVMTAPGDGFESVAAEVASLIADSTLMRIAGESFAVPLTDPIEFSDVVVRFLDRG